MIKTKNKQHMPTADTQKIIMERYYVVTEKMETVFNRIAGEQIPKKVKVTVHCNVNLTGIYTPTYISIV